MQKYKDALNIDAKTGTLRVNVFEIWVIQLKVKINGKIQQKGSTLLDIKRHTYRSPGVSKIISAVVSAHKHMLRNIFTKKA